MHITASFLSPKPPFIIMQKTSHKAAKTTEMMVSKLATLLYIMPL